MSLIIPYVLLEWATRYSGTTNHWSTPISYSITAACRLDLVSQLLYVLAWRISIASTLRSLIRFSSLYFVWPMIDAGRIVLLLHSLSASKRARLWKANQCLAHHHSWIMLPFLAHRDLNSAGVKRNRQHPRKYVFLQKNSKATARYHTAHIPYRVHCVLLYIFYNSKNDSSMNGDPYYSCDPSTSQDP